MKKRWAAMTAGVLCQVSLALSLSLGLSWGASAPARAAAETFAKPDAEGTVDVSTDRPARTLAIIMSGDGGWWGDLDAQLANRIAHAGYAVVGLDTNIWFTSLRTPQEVADHLSTLAQRYMTKTGATKYVLIGYSFGADMLAPAFSRMSAALEAEAGALVMLSPGKNASFQVNVLEETGVEAGKYSLSADFARLPKALTTCLYGEEEKSDTGCTDPALSGAALVPLPGGHHYNHDTPTLTAHVLGALKRRTPA